MRIKAILLGESGVGKENLIEALQGKNFSPKQQTIGVEFFLLKVDIQKEVSIQFWSTAGQERFRSLTPMYMREAKIVFLIYDITSKKTFEKLPGWLEDVKKNTEGYNLFIVGNKLDLAEQQREVTNEEVVKFAEENDAVHFEVSAKELTNIDQLLTAIQKTVRSQLYPDVKKSAEGVQTESKVFQQKIDDLRAYAGILKKLKNKEYFSAAPEKKSQAITDFLAKSLTKVSVEAILKNENDPLIKNRNIFGNGFFRIKSKVLGHTNPLRDGRACVSDTEWKLVQIYNALAESKQDDALELSEDSQSSSAP